MSDNTFSFPNSSIDPKKKGKDYILQYAKAAFETSRGYTVGWFNRKKMSVIRSYAVGAQDVAKYKTQLLPSENTDESWQAIKWEVLAFIPKFRSIVKAKLKQQGIEVQIKAIDPLSKSEEDTYFNQMKVKIQMRQMAEQAGSELSQSPLLQPNPNEPEDLEQLEMDREFGYKHVMEQEAELAIALARQNSNFSEVEEDLLLDDFIDHGVGGLTQYIDENGQVKERAVRMKNFIPSKFTKPDGSDMTYCGEVIEVPLTRLAPYFSPSERVAICNKVKGQNGNPAFFDETKDNYLEGFNAYVFVGEFLDVNTQAYEERIDTNGNLRFGKASYNYLLKGSDDVEAATEQTSDGTAKYTSSTEQVKYKFKWIIDTDFIYDFGLAENMSRRESDYWNTCLDTKLFAWNFENMKFHGLTETLIPMADDICTTWYKMQNLRNTLMPYILNMDLDSFEGISFGKAGVTTSPIDAVDFLYSKYVAVYRSLDKFTNNPNYKPVSVESTGQLTILAQYRDELFSHIDLMRQTCGLNEITDGSAPNPKNLNSTNAAGIESTNNALYPIHNAHKYVVLKGADNIILKQQIAVTLGKVEGTVRALGKDTMMMYQINPNISLREFGLAAQDAPTEMQRQQLWDEINAKESIGLLDVTDKIIVEECTNLKQAYKLLAYRIKKRKEEQKQFELQKIQEQNDGQAQMSIQVEQAKQQTIQLQAQLNMQQLNTQMQWQFVIEKMKKEIDFNAESVQAEARNVGHQIQAEAKVISTHIQVEGQKEKQHIANKKPKTKTA